MNALCLNLRQNANETIKEEVDEQKINDNGKEVDNNSSEEEIKLTSHLNYPDMVYDYVFRVSWGRDTLAARFTKRDCKDNVAGYPFTAA